MRQSAAPIALALLAPAAATACGACTTALAEQAFPPVLPWSIIGPLWFLALSASQAATRCDVPRVPGLIKATALSVAIALLGGATLGAAAPMLLIVPSALGSIAVLRRRSQSAELEPKSRSHRRAVAILCLAACLFLLATGVASTVRQSRRADVDIILRWDGTGPMRRYEDRLSKRGAEAVSDWRELLARSENLAATVAAENLAALGDPVVDVPLMIDAVERLRAKPDTNWYAEQVEESLAKLSAIEAPNETSVDEWRRLWNEKQQ